MTLSALTLLSLAYLARIRHAENSFELKSRTVPISAVEAKLVGDVFSDFHRNLKQMEFESVRNDEEDSAHPLPSMV
jgi:hypothetical protein